MKLGAGVMGWVVIGSVASSGSGTCSSGILDRV